MMAARSAPTTATCGSGAISLMFRSSLARSRKAIRHDVLLTILPAAVPQAACVTSLRRASCWRVIPRAVSLITCARPDSGLVAIRPAKQPRAFPRPLFPGEVARPGRGSRSASPSCGRPPGGGEGRRYGAGAALETARRHRPGGPGPAIAGGQRLSRLRSRFLKMWAMLLTITSAGTYSWSAADATNSGGASVKPGFRTLGMPDWSNAEIRLWGSEWPGPGGRR